MTIDPLLSEGVLAAAVPWVPFASVAAAGVAQVANDAAVREALCTFYNLTSGPYWAANEGWCDPTTPICSNGTQSGWFGVGCDSTNSFVTALQLGGNGLTSQTAVDISPLLEVLDQLTDLDFSVNGELLLSRLDLSCLTNLIHLNLARIPPFATGFQSMILPTPLCQLRSINIDYTSFEVQGWTTCTHLTMINIEAVQAPSSLAMIAYMPMLQSLSATASAIDSAAVGSYGDGRTGGELTNYILAHLNETNPELTSLDLRDCIHLRFGLPNATDNLPRIVSSSLTSLHLDQLPQLRTGPMGPADDRWLEGMPALTVLYLPGMPSAVINTAALLYASRALQNVACDNVIGEITPLLSLSSLTSIFLTGSSLHWRLPSNLSAVWPQLQKFSCSNCNLEGPLPDFHNLRALTIVCRTAEHHRGTDPLAAEVAHSLWL